MRAWVLVTALGTAAAGCSLSHAPEHNEVVQQALPKTTSIPAAWRAEVGNGPVTDAWLHTLNDPTLDAIVAEALVNNLDLRQAAERVAVAQQAVVVVGSKLLPQIGVEIGGRTTRDLSQDSTFNGTRAYAGVAWEADIWGKLRAQRAAAAAGFQATALDYAFARQSLVATVAKSWYLCTETRQLLSLAEQAVEIYRHLLELTTIRRSAGKDTDLEVADTRARLESAMSQVESARQSFGEARRALEVLLGRYPAAEIEVAVAYPNLPPTPATGVPATLLERRPDIVAAERRVLAAFREEEAAKLALRPDLSISLGAGRLDDQLLSLLNLNPWFASAAIGITMPIFEGGALHAKIRITSAREVEAVAHYGSAMLTAFGEVEDLLANDQLLARQLPLETNAVSAGAEAVRIATEQYLAGRRDMLWVTNLQADQLVNEADLTRLHGVQRLTRVNLDLALGGSFDATPAATIQGIK